jgi:hypothetical protein
MDDLNPAIDFWQDVQEALQKTFGMSPDKARGAIDEYRRRMADHAALDVVYNAEPNHIAKAIHGGRYKIHPLTS